MFDLFFSERWRLIQIFSIVEKIHAPCQSEVANPSDAEKSWRAKTLVFLLLHWKRRKGFLDLGTEVKLREDRIQKLDVFTEIILWTVWEKKKENLQRSLSLSLTLSHSLFLSPTLTLSRFPPPSPTYAHKIRGNLSRKHIHVVTLTRKHTSINCAKYTCQSCSAVLSFFSFFKIGGWGVGGGRVRKKGGGLPCTVNWKLHGEPPINNNSNKANQLVHLQENKMGIGGTWIPTSRCRVCTHKHAPVNESKILPKKCNLYLVCPLICSPVAVCKDLGCRPPWHDSEQYVQEVHQWIVLSWHTRQLGLRCTRFRPCSVYTEPGTFLEHPGKLYTVQHLHAKTAHEWKASKIWLMYAPINLSRLVNLIIFTTDGVANKEAGGCPFGNTWEKWQRCMTIRLMIIFAINK